MAGTAALSAAALLMAGCSSSGSKATNKGSTGTTASGGASVSAGGSTAPKPTGSPIKIGLIASLTGPQASSSDQGATVGPAWVKYVNDQLGGINGHPVQIIVKDDGGQPTTAAAAVNSLISQHVVALLAGSDNLLPAYSALTIKAGIPVISGTANAADWYTKALMFPTVTDVASGSFAQVYVAKNFGHAKKFANLYCSEIAACKLASPAFKGATAKLGLGYTELAISSTATSYNAQCLALKQDGVDYVQLNFSTAASIKLIGDCQAQGYNPTWGSSGQSVGPSLLPVKNLKMFGPDFAFPSAGQSPAVTTFTNAMTKYAKDGNWKDEAASFDYTGLVALQKALATVSPSATVTAQDVADGLYAFKGETLDGLAANKLTFSKTKPIAYGSQPCFFVIGVAGGKVTAPNAMKPVCPTSG